ncbi:MAG: hypothetical protein WCG25_06565 [bacterium]
MKKLNSFVDYIRKFPPGIFLVLMLIIGIIWMYLWGNFFLGSIKFISKDVLWSQILRQPMIAFQEEFLWRFVPFTIMTGIWFIGIKIKIPNIVLILITVITIINVQIIFGLAHVVWDPDLRMLLDMPRIPSLNEKIQHLVIQGGVAIILSFIYFKFLLHSKKIFKYIQILPLLACSIVHMLYNQIVMYLGSF